MDPKLAPATRHAGQMQSVCAPTLKGDALFRVGAPLARLGSQ